MVDCYCCTCTQQPGRSGESILKIDPACRSHGAHGIRECVVHKMPPEACKYDDGCGMTIDKVSGREH